MNIRTREIDAKPRAHENRDHRDEVEANGAKIHEADDADVYAHDAHRHPESGDLKRRKK